MTRGDERSFTLTRVCSDSTKGVSSTPLFKQDDNSSKVRIQSSVTTNSFCNLKSCLCSAEASLSATTHFSHAAAAQQSFLFCACARIPFMFVHCVPRVLRRRILFYTSYTVVFLGLRPVRKLTISNNCLYCACAEQWGGRCILLTLGFSPESYSS